MPYKRIILEMGAGNDLYGEDYTKAACRAVQDALHHSSLSLFKTLGLDRGAMQVEVTIGVQEPTQIDTQAVASQVPFGSVTVVTKTGGLNVADVDPQQVSVIAVASIAVRLDLPEGKFVISEDA